MLNFITSTPGPFSLRRRGAGDEVLGLIPRSLLRRINIIPERYLAALRRGGSIPFWDLGY